MKCRKGTLIATYVARVLDELKALTGPFIMTRSLNMPEYAILISRCLIALHNRLKDSLEDKVKRDQEKIAIRYVGNRHTLAPKDFNIMKERRSLYIHQTLLSVEPCKFSPVKPIS